MGALIGGLARGRLWGFIVVVSCGRPKADRRWVGFGGWQRRLWTRAGPFSRISPATVLVGPVYAGSPAGCLGRRLAADLELVRTRGIRLFN